MVLALLRGGHHLFVGPVVLVIIVAIVVLVISSRARARRSTGASRSVAVHDTMSSSPAERILSERFAKGEIDLADYRARLVALRESGVTGEDSETER